MAKPTIEFSTVSVFGWLVVVASCQLKGENPSLKRVVSKSLSFTPPQSGRETIEASN